MPDTPEDRRIQRIGVLWPVISGLAMALIWAIVRCTLIASDIVTVKEDMKIQHERRDQTIKELNDRQRADHDKITDNAKDIEWLKRR